ncbi:lytic transglycosylase domain-containing protein [Chromobacterium vaccinii]|uniref:lytic transglycosylase domain-containing protein n=1 Tax=Chromobacterium vaccinii TaxID=1108595 RepID=UPI00345889A8
MLPKILIIGCLSASSSLSWAASNTFTVLANQCAAGVHHDTLQALAMTESGMNPFAIGVVNGRLTRQPTSLKEAIATTEMLKKNGFNFSMGWTQVNLHNLKSYGETTETIFDPCRNLRTGSAILRTCFTGASKKFNDPQQALRAALSCYYSGNYLRGFKPEGNKPSYVQKVVFNAAKGGEPKIVVPALRPTDKEIQVITNLPAGRASRKQVNKTISSARDTAPLALQERGETTARNTPPWVLVASTGQANTAVNGMPGWAGALADAAAPTAAPVQSDITRTPPLKTAPTAAPVDKTLESPVIARRADAPDQALATPANSFVMIAQ